MFDLHRKLFHIVRSDNPELEANAETIFAFKQEGDLVLGEYAGGRIRAGRLVGIIHGDRLEIGYVQVNQGGELSAGRAVDRLETMSDGRTRIVDQWEWDLEGDHPGTVLEEI